MYTCDVRVRLAHTRLHLIVRASYTFLGCWLAVVALVMATLPPSILHARDQLSADFDWLCVPHDMLILDDLCSTS